MKPFRFLNYLLILLSISTMGVAADSSEVTLTKKRVIADLESIGNMFDVKYAPKPWKEEFANWDLHVAIEEAKNKINSHPSPTLKECQVVLRDFFNSTKDYHVGVRFYSTESATLPFLIKGAEGRYFICHVERDQISKREFPFDEGDEILTFERRPIHDVVEELRLREYGTNTLETDRELAEKSLTQRRGDMGHLIPSGNVEITGIKKSDGRRIRTLIKWNYIPEKIRDFSKLGSKVDFNFLVQAEGGIHDLHSLLRKSHFFEKLMVASFWDKSYVGASLETNKHALGARTSFIPILGDKNWSSNANDVFDAYIFVTSSGKKIGYIRLPHYMGDADEVEEFGKIMNIFQKRTDALILDQVNNPGGSLFYLYALASILTDKPLYAPKHRIAMTQEEVYIAQVLLPYLEQVTNTETARVVLGETIGGYPVDFRFATLMKQFCHFLIAQWNKGQFFSDPTFLFGWDEIKPHPKYCYTKPILLLINSLDFSGGDFFPAILQDNKRATIMGTRTAGAGGYVLTTEFPNHSGIKGFIMTGSLAERIDKKPIENLGVLPDISYNCSVIDLQENYKEYVSAILETVDSLVIQR